MHFNHSQGTCHPEPCKVKSDRTVAKKWLSGLPKNDPQSDPKSDFSAQKSHFWATSRVKKSLLGSLSGSLWEAQSHFLVTFPWWTFRIFVYFFYSWEGKGEFEAPGRRGGVQFSIENSRSGGGSQGEGGRGWGAGRRSAGNLGGGGVNIFVRGWNAHQVSVTLNFPGSGARRGIPGSQSKLICWEKYTCNAKEKSWNFGGIP